MNIIYNYWLSTTGIGNRRINQVVGCLGSAAAAWGAGREELCSIEGIRPEDADKIIECKDEDRLYKEIKKIESVGIRLISVDDSEYPQNLKNIFDPPLILYSKGKFKTCSRNIAIVGSRKCTPYGREVARKFARLLAGAGIGIISGMARGIDTEAHLGALDVDGFTCAVLGCGCDVVYPPENKRLMMDIEVRGSILSEYPPNTMPLAYNFPARNRIISGISDGILVVEADEKSGALITVNYGLEQGRDIFSVPGSILSRLSKGTNLLIRDGAKIVVCVEDILSEIGFDISTGRHEENMPSLTNREKIVADIINDSPIYIDDLIERMSLKVSEINSVLTSLELKGVVKVLPGKYIVRTF
jgi:DNA protecting protein DprA